MKHLFLCGAALCAMTSIAAPAKAEGLDMKIGGFAFAYGVYNNQDEPTGTSFRSFDLRKETEIHVEGETTLDNGLTVGARVELNVDRVDNGNETMIEESYVYFSGPWGKLSLGEDDGAAFLMQVSAPSADPTIDGVRQYINSFDLGQLIGANTGLVVDRLDYDHTIAGGANKISYFTPVYSGFQVGASYVPGVSEADQDGLAAITADNNAGQYDDGLELAARYEGNFDEIDVKLGAGWSDYNREAKAANQEDRSSWNAGVDLGWGPFGLGFGYFRDDNGIASNGDTSAFAVGADYVTGPYKIGLSYYSRSDDQNAGTHTTAGDIEMHRWTGGVTYEYGPGMSLRGSLSFVEGESDAAGDVERDGYQLAIGTAIDF